MAKIIGIVGKKGHGKDTIADYFVKTYKYQKISFADPLKSAVKELFDFSDEQLYGSQKEVIDIYWKVSPRVVLQYLGTEVFRKSISEIIPNLNGDFWIKCFERHCQQIKVKDTKIVIPDVRFQNEVDKIKELGGVIIKVVRPNMLDIDEHISETTSDKLQGIDFIFVNDGLLYDLYDKIDVFMF